jgi:hypothetical protein
MSKFTERMLVLYNSKKNLSTKPSYMDDLKAVLKSDGLLGDDKDVNNLSR